jgi:translation elongation factor EF-4
MHPEEVPTSQLLPGQVGYIACNMKQSSEGEILNSVHFDLPHVGMVAHVGDTLHRAGYPVEPMPGFQPAKAMVCSTALYGSILV